jgi:acyl-CoA reductase-like NAD-dependent aldehyde dehydrogenase
MENRIAVNKTYKIYVDGKFPRTESGRYYEFKSKTGEMSANICQCSRKDLRDAVTAARNAQSKWASATAYNRGQILYRIAEMLEARRGQFIEELLWQGSTETEAKAEVTQAIERLVYYAGWSDKYQQLFSTVNPVASSHFNFSMLEATGVVTVAAPESPALLGLVSLIAPVIIGGNTCVVLGSASRPLSAVTFAEVLNSSDVPSGVVNILTGFRKELLSQFAAHMDVNAVIYAGDSVEEKSAVETQAIENLKRVRTYMDLDWDREKSESPYMILDFQETKTTWHPVGI